FSSGPTATSFQSRYAWNINADTSAGSTHDTSGNAQHNVTFSAVAPGSYTVTITEQRLGDINLVNDTAGCNGSADTGGVGFGTNIALTSGNLGLADPGQIGNTGATQSQSISQSVSGTICRVSNTVTQNHSLSFTWNGSVRS